MFESVEKTVAQGLIIDPDSLYSAFEQVTDGRKKSGMACICFSMSAAQRSKYHSYQKPGHTDLLGRGQQDCNDNNLRSDCSLIAYSLQKRTLHSLQCLSQ